MARDDADDAAQDRTNLAEDRTVLAHERSFAGWMRTGMAAIGIGLGLSALFRSLEPTWVVKAIATGFFLLAMLIFLLAERRATRLMKRLDVHEIAEMKPVALRSLTAISVALTLIVTAAMWLFVTA